LIFAHWRLSTLTQYLTWFGKPPTSTGEAIALYRKRTRFTTIEEEESSPLYQLSTSFYFSLLSAVMVATAGCLGSPLSPIFLTSLALHSHFALNKTCLFIGKYGQHGRANIALKHGMNCGTIHAPTCLVVEYCHK